jgi:hypothetical protein
MKGKTEMRKIRHLPENVQAHACYYYGMDLGHHVKKWHRAVIRLEKEILEEEQQRRKREQQLLDEIELLVQAMEEE